jgi:uncharacterized protein YqeY
MNLKDKIDQDVKAALLGGDKERALTLRNIKAAILNEEVAKGIRDSGLPDDQIIAILQKEAKKRQESADLYIQGGNQEKASAELSEKKIIEEYLPAQLSEDEVKELIDVVETEQGAVTKETMGATIAAVKQKSGGAADGATIARLVRERISQ